MARAWNRTDFDGAWKEALEQYLRPFLVLCFPKVEAGIDWRHPVEFVDKELPALRSSTGKGSAAGRKYVDKLIKVHRTSGQVQRVLVHVEIQTQPDPDLPGRLYQYHRRLSEVRGLPVVTLAVLADTQPGCVAKPFAWALWDCWIQFGYATCKLSALDEAVLQEEGSAIGRFILAHRAAQRTVRDPRARMRLKRALIEEACGHHGFTDEEIRELLSLVDKLTRLPEKEEQELMAELEKRQRRNVMTYITSFERHGLRKGMRKGLRQGLRQGRQEGRQEGRVVALRELVREALEARFGVVSHEDGDRIESECDPEVLRHWHRRAITVLSTDQVWTSGR